MRKIVAALAAAALPTLAAAQERLPAYVADTVVVTTKRYPALRTEVPQKIEVISEHDIRRSTADELVDVLKEQAAVEVIQYPGLLSGVGIRGFRPEFSGINKRTLLLIDGRPAGATNLSTIDLNAIERIEVLKGPASSLYGSSAMGGAVNLITRRSTGALRGNFTAAYGSFQTLDLSARAGGSFGTRLDADLGFSRFSRGEDYRLGEGNFFRDRVGSETAEKLIGGTVELVPEKGDGIVVPNSQYTYQSGSARVGVRLSDAFRVDVRGELFRADDVETPPDLYSQFDPGGKKNLARRTGDVALSGAWGRHTPLLQVFGAREETEFFNTFAKEPFISFIGDTETRGLQLQNAVRFGAHALTAGFDYTAAEASSSSFSAVNTPSAPFSPNSGTYSAALFAEGKLSLLEGRLTGTLGGRFDRLTLDFQETPLRTDIPEKEDFTLFIPSAGLQYALAEGVRVHGTAGQAFVAPNAFHKAGLSVQRRSGVATLGVGNPEIDPERSFTVDFGVGFARRTLGIDADVTYFRTRVDDRITTASAFFSGASRPRTAEGDVVGTVRTYVNASEAEMEGVELRLGYDLGALADYRYSLRFFTNTTHYLTKEETAQGVRVDAKRFAGRTDFRPEEVFGALVFGEETTSEIRNVADRTVNYGIDFDDLRRFSTRLTGRYVGERLDVDFSDFSRISDVRYPAFMTLDLVSTVRFAERFSASLLVDNLTDENYYEKRGFNLPGRQLRLRLSADF
jgi:vitamin B12 transporter